MSAMASNIFKVLALIPLLQCAYPLGIDVEVEVDLCPSTDVDIVTTLYTNLTSTVITADANSVAAATFSGKEELVVIIPDYNISSESIEVNALINALISANVNINIIVADILPVLKALVGFVQAVVNGVLQIADGLLRLLKIVLDLKVEITKVRVIGIGLGGQIAGKLGSLLKVAGIVLDKVTALDPLGPLFGDSLLSMSVATFVEVFHSNAGGIGHGKWLGHVDIIMGDGKSQPGCPSATYPSIDLCSHISALLYYIQIVNGKSIIGKKCVDLGVSFPDPLNDCQKTYSAFELLDVVAKASICALGGGDLVTIGLDADAPRLEGAIHVDEGVLLNLL